jgi:hypothetical protein
LIYPTDIITSSNKIPITKEAVKSDKNNTNYGKKIEVCETDKSGRINNQN